MAPAADIQLAPRTDFSFEPITRPAAAGIMDVSPRTLENWAAKGFTPQPELIGGRRFWHPDVFYSWLDATLKGQRRWEVRRVPAFKPITRKAAAAVLGVSIKTVENWCDEKTMPEPTSIGGRRYWHPETFYAWLDTRLKGRAWSPDAREEGDTDPQGVVAAPARQPWTESQVPPSTRVAPSAVRKSRDLGAMTTSVAKAKSRTAARLAELNG